MNAYNPDLPFRYCLYCDGLMDSNDEVHQDFKTCIESLKAEIKSETYWANYYLKLWEGLREWIVPAISQLEECLLEKDDPRIVEIINNLKKYSSG